MARHLVDELQVLRQRLLVLFVGCIECILEWRSHLLLNTTSMGWLRRALRWDEEMGHTWSGTYMGSLEYECSKMFPPQHPSITWSGIRTQPE